MGPSEYPRSTSRDGVATPDTQPNTTGKISITTLIRIRQEKIMFSFQNKKVLLLRSMLVRTPAIRPNATAEIHLFTAIVADRMGTWQGGAISFNIRLFSRTFLLTLLKSFLSDILCSNRGLSVTRLGDWSPMAVKNASPFFLI